MRGRGNFGHFREEIEKVALNTQFWLLCSLRLNVSTEI